MNRLAINRQPKNPDCDGSMRLAERELAAFFGGVTKLFGSELAKLSAEEWLRQLESPDHLPSSAHEWRWLSAKVSAWLAMGTNAVSLSTEFATA
jgi:hypothetical protein